MKRIINEVDAELETINKLKYILSQLRLWIACKFNHPAGLPDYEIDRLENLVSTITEEEKIKYLYICNLINHYIDLIKIPYYELLENMDKQKIKK